MLSLASCTIFLVGVLLVVSVGWSSTGSDFIMEISIKKKGASPLCCTDQNLCSGISDRWTVGLDDFKDLFQPW